MKECDKSGSYDSRRLAALLGLSQASCRKLGKEGKIKYTMSGSKMLFDANSVKRYLEV